MSNYCPTHFRSVISISVILFDSITCIFHCVLLRTFIKFRYSYHPLFIGYYMVFILCYFFTLFATSCRQLRNFTDSEYTRFLFSFWFDITYTIAELAIQPVSLVCLLERCYATYKASSYEHTKSGFLFCVIFLVLVSLVGFEYLLLLKNDAWAERLKFIYACLTAALISSLYFLNRRWVMNFKAQLNLTTRYQIAENLKSLRIFFPYAICELIICIVFAILPIFGVQMYFQEFMCTHLYYPFLYLFGRIILQFLLITTPIAVILSEKMFKEYLKSWFSFRDLNKKKPITKKSVNIVNVLGHRISFVETGITGQNNHFHHLTSAWA